MKAINTKSISFRLSLYIFILSIFMSVIFTSVQFFLKYRSEIKKTENKIEEIKNTQLESIELQLWNMDRSAIQIILEGLVALPDISYAQIKALNKELYSDAGKINKKHSVKKVFELKFTPPKRATEKIGELSIYISRSSIISRLLEKAFSIIIPQAVQIFIVAFCIFFITQIIIIEPLHNMAQYTKELDLNSIDSPFLLKRKLKPSGKDDIDLVADAINRMKYSIKLSRDTLGEKLKMEGEFNAASKIQQYSLIEKAPAVKEYDISFYYNPGRIVSGDFYDIIKVDDENILFLIGDVSGKGLASSLTAHTSRILLRSRNNLYLKPKKLFSFLNDVLTKELPSNYFITFSYSVLDIDKNRIDLYNFGHEPAYLFKSNDLNFYSINPKGYPISKLHFKKFDSSIESDSIIMKKNDILLLYTDGLTDSLGIISDTPGEQILKDLIFKNRDKTGEDIKNAIVDFLETDVFFQEKDDITIIIIKKEV